MLLEYSVENFRTFRDKATLKMMDKDGNPLRTAVFLGANSSGKSNFLKSLFISSNFIRGAIEQVKDNISIYDTYCHNEKPTTYSYTFKQDNTFVRYTFSLVAKDKIDTEILEIGKCLNSFEIIYKRKYPDIEIIAKNNKELSDKMEAMKSLFLKTGNTAKVLFLKTTIGMMEDTTFEIRIIKNFFDRLHASDINVYITMSDVLTDNKLKPLLIEFLKMADNTVKGIEVISEGNYTIIHDIDGQNFNMPLSQESGGLYVFWHLFKLIHIMLKEQRITIVDELDSKLHYDLLSYLVTLIDQNETNSQLIFTCHNIGSLYWNLENENYNIMEKKSGASYITRADDIIEDTNTDERIKAYMKGRLGGFPNYELVNKAFENFKNLGVL